jgi:Type II secretion system (T2SS), protein G
MFSESVMAVASHCPHCGVAYSFTNDLTGQEVHCDECLGTFVVGVPVPHTKPNAGGNREGGIKATAGPMQSQAPRFLPQGNDQDELTRRPSLTKKSGCSTAQIVVLLAILLVVGGGGFVCICIVNRYMDELTKEKAAWIYIQTWEGAVCDYYLDYQKYPESLKELTETLPDGRPAKVHQSFLIDPWGQPFQYDPKTLESRDKRPRIWSSGEPGARHPIANW